MIKTLEVVGCAGMSLAIIIELICLKTIINNIQWLSWDKVLGKYMAGPSQWVYGCWHRMHQISIILMVISLMFIIVLYLLSKKISYLWEGLLGTMIIVGVWVYDGKIRNKKLIR